MSLRSCRLRAVDRTCGLRLLIEPPPPFALSWGHGRPPIKPATTAVKETAHAVEKQSRKVADSAEELKHCWTRIEASADRTTQLAADRNILAAERTYAAWVRTGLLALAGGLEARALQNVIPEWFILANGTC